MHRTRANALRHRIPWHYLLKANCITGRIRAIALQLRSRKYFTEFVRVKILRARKQWRRDFFFFKERYSGFVSVSATRAEQRPEGSKLFFLFLRFLPPPTGSFTVISVPKVYGVSSRFKHPCSPFLFFSRVTLSWSTSSFERRAGIKSRAVIMNDSRGEREDIIVIDGREGRSRGWLPFNLEANPFVHLLPLLPGRHRAA